jgi:hypothetical protein
MSRQATLWVRRCRAPLGSRNIGPRFQPLTERILAALPAPRPLWIALWALLPPLNAGANLLLDTDSRSPVWEQSGVLVFLNYATLTFAIVITLWGNRRIARRLDSLRSPTSKLLGLEATESFREMNSVPGPLLLSVAAAAVFGLSTAFSVGWESGLLRAATWLLIGIPLWTFLWTYVVLQLGLDRLGREHLVPDAVNVDPGLGLRPLGGAAFMGLWMLLAWLVPLVLTGLPDIVGVVVGMVVLAGALSAFFLSLVRLHRQMVDVKRKELAIARDLYAEAYQPVRSTQTLEALDRQRGLLGAADALEKRARDIHEWPIDEGILARVLTIATSVVAITVGRLILDPLGF